MAQVALGLVNGAFYAMLSLGLAVIFGMLNVINFTHGAQFMMGAFAAWLLLGLLDVPFWASLVLAPLIVGLFGVLIERLLLKRIYHLDHLYGFLLTFGLALIIEGVFQWKWGSSGAPYPAPITGATDLGFMIMPTYRLFVVVAALVICLATWYGIERTRLGAYLRAATENPDPGARLRHQRAALITSPTGWAWRSQPSPACWRRHPAGLGADGHQPGAGRVRRRGDRRHGLDHGLDRHRLRVGLIEGLTKVTIRRPPTP
jgi:Branched-chain amino acid ABC-type transport system, permease components